MINILVVFETICGKEMAKEEREGMKKRVLRKKPG